MGGVRRITAFIIFLAVLAISNGAVSAGNWTVNPGDSIQSAVNNASANDTIIVNDNNGTAYTYTENVVINKKLVLQSFSGLVSVKASNPNNAVFTITSTGTSSTIQGFIINGGYDGIK